ncbi:hypothetical protein dsx2_3208 [Desulfovibrio sp. X2]|uniref:tetratricopeptide repeat protein n=1 Tax=Desulfovibrio sp. X2 TaxID=941449 RepID=UPI0003586E36|nr:hypothetical protein [Desulfovibrio sp. X2]EPR41455.1 hypothetical protein dsx2_3208 [Desulfovibrio sp. X2]
MAFTTPRTGQFTAFGLLAALLLLAGCTDYARGNSALRQDKPGEAAQAYSQVPAGQPDYDSARDRLGLALLWDGKPKEAETVLRENLSRDPEDWMSSYYLVGTLACQGKKDEARRMLGDVRATFKPFMTMEMRQNVGQLFGFDLSCPETASRLWDIQKTAEENEFWREVRARDSN